MDTTASLSDDVVTVTRWVARIIAVSMALLALVFISGSGLDPFHAKGPALLQMACFALIWGGLLIGWRWNMLGGALTLGGLLAFFLLDFVTTGSVLRFWVYLIFAIPAVMFLYCGWQERRARQAERTVPAA